ncbi:MAG: metalloprotease PmbA [Marinicella sp.]
MLSTKLVEKVLDQLKRRGATQAEVIYSEGTGVSVSCRKGEVDTIENNQDCSLVLTVYKNQAKGSASTAVVDEASVELTMEKALAIASLTEPDEAAGLADKSLLATEFRELGIYYKNNKSADELVDMALAAEQGALDYAAKVAQAITVDESNVEMGEGFSIYANSQGFVGEKQGSNASASVVAIAEQDGMMEREYWWDASRDINQMASMADIGKQAAIRTLERLGSKKIKSTKAPILFDPSCAKSLIGHMLSAISGSALYQEASFLKDYLQRQLFPDWLSIMENPFLPGGFASRNFDGNGVQTRERALIQAGVLNGFLLSVYSARRLGMQTTGNAGGAHNLLVESSQVAKQDLLQQLDTGLLVTSLMGQGVNTVTGDYSRGASGFWVEKGEIQFPVSELTIAGQLKDMYRSVVAIGDDVDRRSKIQTGSWLIESMTIAGD